MKIATSLLTIIALASSAAAAPAGYEAEPVLKATEAVAPELLKGPHFAVDDRVPVRGYLARFTIRSDYGTFDAHGIKMFHTRVKEVYALNQLAEMSKTKEFAEAAAKAVARPVTSTVNMLVHPVETITGLPDGVARLFDRIKLGGEAVVAAATAPGQSGGEKAAAVSERVGAITVTALGYEKERRDLAKGLGVDPYTTNPVLAKKLDDMAWVAFSGRFGIQAAMSILVPYSMAMSTMTITNSTVYDTPQGDLINGDQAIFAATGASPEAVSALMKNKQYSLTVLTDLALAFQRLQGVNGVGSVVGFAAAARTQDETRFVAESMTMLARYHESVAPLGLVTAPGPIIGRTTTGALVVPAALDYVAWTERTGRFAHRDDLKAPARAGWLSGQLSRRSQKEFTAQGWEMYESFIVSAGK